MTTLGKTFTYYGTNLPFSPLSLAQTEEREQYRVGKNFVSVQEGEEE